MEFLNQTDKRWASETIGSSGLSIGSYGCVITSLCNCANLHGFDWTPDDLNRSLYNNNGLEPNGLVRWAAVEKIFGCRTEPHFFERDKDGKVVAGGTLDFNNLHTFYIGRYRNGSVDHFTNIIGKQGGYYILYDVYGGKTVIKPAAEITRIIKLWW